MHDATVWVCFPPQSGLESAMQYSDIFNFLSLHWKHYTLGFDSTHLCEPGKATFVLEEKVSDGAGEPGATHQAKFRQVVEQRNEMIVTLLDKFLWDVHTGKIKEYTEL